MIAGTVYGDKEVLARCVCQSDEHMARFSLFRWAEGEKEIYLGVHLAYPRSFWKRVWIALVYVFRSRPSKYGCWDEMIVSKEDAQNIREVIDEFLK